MSAGILENDTMFSVKEKPWHGLGTVVENAPSVKEAIHLAGLDWQAELKPLQTLDGDNVETHKAVFRNDNNTLLGVVGSQYKPLQNIDAFAWFEPFVENGLVTLETAGSLFNGKKVFILANTKAEADVVAGDTVQSYILLSNSHDGSSSVKVGFTPIRVVCNNTLTCAENNDLSKLIRVRHTNSVVENLKLVRDIMDTVNNQFTATVEQYKYLATKDVNILDLQKYVKQVFSEAKLEDIIRSYDNKLQEKEEIEKFRKNLMNKVEEYFELEPARKAWNMYNAVNSYLNHDRGRTLETRYNSTWFGSNQRLDKKAFQLALKAY